MNGYSSKILILLVAFVLFNTPNISAEISIPETPPVIFSDPTTPIEKVREELQSLSTPLVEITLKDGAFPTFEFINHPDGCQGLGIQNNEYVEGRMTISVGDDILYDSGEFESGKSGIRLRVRGNTSAQHVKTSYKIKLSKKADLLCREDASTHKDKNWAILGNGAQQLKYVVGTELGRLVGMKWEPAGRHVNVIINNKFVGVYYLVETVEPGSHRVEIEDSGYIVENDPYWWLPSETYFKTENQPTNVGWTFKAPDEDEFTENTVSNISGFLQEAEKAVLSNRDVEKYIDIDSFARWILAHDLLGTTDGLGSNMFVVKRNYFVNDPFASKLEMGPLWDFDTCIYSDKDTFATIHSFPSFWFYKLFENKDFVKSYLDLYNSLKEDVVSFVDDSMQKYLIENPDLYASRLIDEAFGYHYDSNPYDHYLNTLKWFQHRMEVMEDLTNELKQNNVNEIEEDIDVYPLGFYDLTGRRCDKSAKGVVIIQMSNGTTKKIMN